ncbi:MAG TPA: hypothetical protein VFI90_08085 [Rubrobacter sp.]|nr:hypothetical protein [Rubrobacter sp.]
MVLFVVVFMGIYLPGEMFREIYAQKPGFLILPGEVYSPAWFVSTVLLTALGFYMWPHTFGSVFTAENARVIRRNATFLPLYQLIPLFVFFVGFAAVLEVPGLMGEKVDLVLLQISKETFSARGRPDPRYRPPYRAGSMLLMVSSTVLAKNVYKVFVPSTSEQRVGTLAKVIVPIVTELSLWFSLQSGQGIVFLLLLGYSLVPQLFPALLFSLMPNNFVTKWGAAAGIVAGVLTVTYVTVKETTIAEFFPFLPGEIADTNIGIVALVVTFAVLLVVSFVTGGLSVRKEHSA